MKITINVQHLYGNDAPDFNSRAWDEALESALSETAQSYYPQAEIVVRTDAQQASGTTRPIAVYFDDVSPNFVDETDMEYDIQHTARALYDERGQDFFS